MKDFKEELLAGAPAITAKLKIAHAYFFHPKRWVQVGAMLHFSQRELDVALLMVRGKTSKESAEMLKCTMSNVTSYRRRIAWRLGTSRRSVMITKLMMLAFMGEVKC